MHIYVDCNGLANAAANRHATAIGAPPPYVGGFDDQPIAAPPMSLGVQAAPPQQATQDWRAATVALDIVTQVGSYVRNHNATRVYFCQDPKEGSWRKKITPTYKAHREGKLAQDPIRKAAHDVANHAIQQVLPELINLLGCPNFVYPWLESDDMVAAAVANNRGRPGILLTADKDHLQLLDTQTVMIDPTHSIRYHLGPDGRILCDKANGVREALGYTPVQALLIKALMGDSSDNIKGLIGVGEITASKAVLNGQVRQLLTENTGMITPRKSKTNPEPQPVAQNAAEVVRNNIAMMDLLNSRVHEKAREVLRGMEMKGLRPIETHLTRMILWLEQRQGFAPQAAQDTARIICSTYRSQWTS